MSLTSAYRGNPVAPVDRNPASQLLSALSVCRSTYQLALSRSRGKRNGTRAEPPAHLRRGMNPSARRHRAPRLGRARRGTQHRHSPTRAHRGASLRRFPAPGCPGQHQPGEDGARLRGRAVECGQQRGPRRRERLRPGRRGVLPRAGREAGRRSREGRLHPGHLRQPRHAQRRPEPGRQGGEPDGRRAGRRRFHTSTPQHGGYPRPDRRARQTGRAPGALQRSDGDAGRPLLRDRRLAVDHHRRLGPADHLAASRRLPRSGDGADSLGHHRDRARRGASGDLLAGRHRPPVDLQFHHRDHDGAGARRGHRLCDLCRRQLPRGASKRASGGRRGRPIIRTHRAHPHRLRADHRCRVCIDGVHRDRHVQHRRTADRPGRPPGPAGRADRTVRAALPRGAARSGRTATIVGDRLAPSRCARHPPRGRVHDGCAVVPRGHRADHHHLPAQLGRVGDAAADDRFHRRLRCRPETLRPQRDRAGVPDHPGRSRPAQHHRSRGARTRRDGRRPDPAGGHAPLHHPTRRQATPRGVHRLSGGRGRPPTRRRAPSDGHRHTRTQTTRAGCEPVVDRRRRRADAHARARRRNQ